MKKLLILLLLTSNAYATSPAPSAPEVNYFWVQWYVECGATIIDLQEKYNAYRRIADLPPQPVLTRWEISQVVNEYYANENHSWFAQHLSACWDSQIAWEAALNNQRNLLCGE